MSEYSVKTIVDVRDIVPRERHPMIFGAFASLAPGEALLLVNDHDPKPLFYQFQAELGGLFTWDYVDTGPEAWRVRIGKTAFAGAPSGGCTCAH